jgi:phosphoserine aminotransferase
MLLARHHQCSPFPLPVLPLCRMPECQERICSFGAGPTKMPYSVLERLASRICPCSPDELSILEESHRSPLFASVLEECRSQLRSFLGIPLEYEVEFVAGGANLLFSALPLAFTSELESAFPTKAAYICTGLWSKKAMQEAHDLGLEVENIASENVHSLSMDCSFLWMCANETVNGVEFQSSELDWILSRVPEGIPVICDASSSLLSRAFPIEKFGVVFGGVQKNIGPAGVAVVIVRKSLLQRWSSIPRPRKKLPSMMDLVKLFKHRSLLNTPPTFTLFAVQEQLKWLAECFGASIEHIEAVNTKKAAKLYAVIDESGGFYRCSDAVMPNRRSRMNVCWSMRNAQLEEEFVKRASAVGLVQLAGHRDSGLGMRASLYNAVQLQDVERLVHFMRTFQQEKEAEQLNKEK